MGTLIVILIIITIMVGLADNKKKNRGTMDGRYWPKNIEPVNTPSFHIPPLPQEMKIVKSYFNDGWREHVLINHGRYELWPKNFYEIAALALRNLSVAEHRKLKDYLLRKGGSVVLYHVTFKLLRDDKFSIDNLHNGYKIVIDTVEQQLRPAPVTGSTDEKKNKYMASEGRIVKPDAISDVSLPPIPRNIDDNQAPVKEEDIRVDKPAVEKADTGEKEFNSAHTLKEAVIPEVSSPVGQKETNQTPNNIDAISDSLSDIIVSLVAAREESVIDVSDKFERIELEPIKEAASQSPIDNTEPPVPIDIEEILDQINDSNLFPVKKPDTEEIITSESNEVVFEHPYAYDAHKLGKRYQKDMNLSNLQVSLLNKVWGIDNAFTSVEGCCRQTVDTFLTAIKKLENRLKKQNTSLKEEIDHLSELARKINKETGEGYWFFYNEYSGKYFRERMESNAYVTIFKRAENVVRECWGHKRKVSEDYPQHFTGLALEFENRIGNHVNQILTEIVSSIPEPDLVTEIELNKQNTTRWRTKLGQLKQNISKEDFESFPTRVHALFEENQKNPSAENIYFEASKIISAFDKQEAVRLYLYYLHADLKSDKIDEKNLTKTIQKALFKNHQHERTFTDIVAQLKQDRDILAAVAKVDSIYAPIRKKIKLNMEAIKSVQEQDKNTVELLNVYLQDEDEATAEVLLEEKLPGNSEDHAGVKSMGREAPSLFMVEIDLNEKHQELIDLFTSHQFSLSNVQITTFCSEKGLRSGPLINDINEACYEVLDDNLIEERDEEFFDMNEDYYKIITKA